MFQQYKSKNPILMNTGQNNNSLYVPVPTITNNPPTITYAGGRPIYQPVGSLPPYPTNATFSTIVVNDNINLDGNILTTDNAGVGELLLNGIPIATTANISSITDWSLYSAISSINCATNNIINVGNIVGKTGDMNLSNVGSITFDTAGLRAIENLSTINGQPYITGGGGSSNTISGTTTFDTADGGLTPSPAVATISAQNGLYGKVDISASAGTGGNLGGNVSITANGGSGGSGLFGQIDIIANQGSASGVTTGGKINITANSGLSGGVTSAINVNAGGITIQSGFTSPVGSVGGYTFVGGNLGVNICGGSPAVIPNVPGTTYIYGTTGVEIPSDMYANNIFPYQYGILNGADLVVSGREYNIGLGNHIAYVKLEKAKSISFGGTTDVGNIGEINGLSTINGQPYVSGGGGGVTTLNSLTGAITIQAGSNISVVTTPGLITINQINQAITNRASSTTPISITATTSGTAQTIGNLSMLTTAIYDLDIFACVVFTTNTNTIVDINCFITIDGVQVGQVFSSSINGIGHFLTFPVQCSLLSASATTHTVLLKCYASATANITMNSYQLSGIGNLA